MRVSVEDKVYSICFNYLHSLVSKYEEIKREKDPEIKFYLQNGPGTELRHRKYYNTYKPPIEELISDIGELEIQINELESQINEDFHNNEK